jgi:hypothetical protein
MEKSIAGADSEPTASRLSASKRKLFRNVGTVTLLFGLADIVMWYENTNTKLAGGRDLSSLFWTGLLIITLGVCVFLRFRWAIIVISVLYAVLGGWLTVGSILAVPFPWLLINVGLAARLKTLMKV